MRRKTDLKKNKVFYKVNYRNRKLYKKNWTKKLQNRRQ